MHIMYKTLGSKGLIYVDINSIQYTLGRNTCNRNTCNRKMLVENCNS